MGRSATTGRRTRLDEDACRAWVGARPVYDHRTMAWSSRRRGPPSGRENAAIDSNLSSRSAARDILGWLMGHGPTRAKTLSTGSSPLPTADSLPRAYPKRGDTDVVSLAGVHEVGGTLRSVGACRSAQHPRFHRQLAQNCTGPLRETPAGLFQPAMGVPEIRALKDEVKNKPFGYALEHKDTLRLNPAPIVVKMLEDAHKGTDDEMEMLRRVSGVSYSAASDTTVSALRSFFLAMALYPTIQSKAQTEIDALLSAPGGMFPTFEHKASLPYVEALLPEVLRWRPVLPLSVPHATSACQGNPCSDQFHCQSDL
uniref:Cytochrome P450 n=1 Tax=Mycena chlorophos TaxID=658473 RepID=A0ABQ0L2G2_MYCCL|nr:cytochrome P450 [Mycena chlorophos]